MFSNIDALRLGNLLQIVFSEGVRNQLSETYREWEQIKRYRVSNSQAREVRFSVQKGYGPAAIQYRNPGTTNRPFPIGQQSDVSEHIARFKEIDATVELEYNLYDRALSTPEKYAEPLALEIQNKTTGSRRRIASDWYDDGTGVIATAASVDDTNIAAGRIVVTLSTADSARGSIGRFEMQDLVLCKQADSSARNPSGGTGANFAAYRVLKKDRRNDKVTLQLVNSSGAITENYGASGITSGDVFYRIGQDTIPDLTNLTGKDYGTLTEVPAGLASLVAADGRLVHGMTMEGATAGTELDQGGDALDARMIQEAMDLVKVNVGSDAYRWAKMCMAPENGAKLINSRETDRRFQSVEDGKRGVKRWGYQHENDLVEVFSTEFISKKRIYGLPEEKSGKKVMEFYGTDFKPVKLPGQGEFFLKPGSSGSYVNMVNSFLHSCFVYICKHPAAVWSLRNFT